jgi:hypothetical protein
VACRSRTQTNSGYTTDSLTALTSTSQWGSTQGVLHLLFGLLIRTERDPAYAARGTSWNLPRVLGGRPSARRIGANQRVKGLSSRSRSYQATHNSLRRCCFLRGVVCSHNIGPESPIIVMKGADGVEMLKMRPPSFLSSGLVVSL